MRVAQGSDLSFTTTSDDYKARLTGPDNLDEEVRLEKELPTKQPGFYTLTVMDRRMRTLTATLEGQEGFAVPRTESATKKEMVTLRYEVH
ncbi:hypothetical protein JRI60_07285 [Archangium violaceum]|uniref:hypothetical protein n=1 Tax=Archangium violaceum TaxID=83451 RepID=UPI0019512876|nr:hypothetical protein [Archangium violaceum]QRN98825.1 hypothetical protein JRI60_07285 [Archangium violaceum]